MRLTKAQILELYLNQVYFGAGAYGVEAASRRYFNKSARKLTLAEAAIIAGLLKAPSRYSPANNPGAARARGEVVLDGMVDAGFITEAQKARALAYPVAFSNPKDEKIEDDAGYVIDYVLDRLPPMAGDGHAELVVETTLDPNLQRRAQQIVTHSLDRRGAALKAGEAALVVLDSEGGIRALVGGRDYAKSQFDRAVKAYRQPGSAFKPFVYLAAIDQGFTPDSVERDAPIRIGNWSPSNDDGKFAGPVTLRRALAESINTVAVRLNESIGRGKAIDVARSLGIKSELRDGPSLPLGTSEVSLLELTGAYTAFSNGGYAVKPHVISRVRTGAGRVLFEDAASSNRVIGADQLGALNDMMNAVVVYGTGKRAALPDQPVGGKTGTTQDFRDAWFVGYTSHFTAGVWVGNDDGKPMNHTTGGSLPAEIWHRVMDVANRGRPPLPLPGTTVLARAAGIGDSNEVVGASSSSRALRVVQVHEELPWLARLKSNYGLSGQRQAISAAPADLARPSHPIRSIGEDFIAQALSQSDTGNRAERPADSRARETALEPMSPAGW
jgi:penicillin-binding protein 1A